APTYTVTGNIMGTMAYISPEQVQGERTDKRSDIYSLGVILYEMATGRIPFTSEQPATILYQHINEPPPLPTSINPDIPELVEQVILKALNKNPDDRYQSAGNLVKALAEAIRADAFITGETLPDDYGKKEKIGEGGMAIVFKAYQHSQKRHVAIKVLKPSLVNTNYISLLQRETELIAQLNHPNILPIYDFKVEGDYSYIV
ncbi:MAG: protein kinase, partial [Oceanicoccus sp.]|uniref:protein kinase domain-containing protein n=1 Tax=Oceanicoccus sp. TaxID=2691044 RepID=UPI002605289A